MSGLLAGTDCGRGREALPHVVPVAARVTSHAEVLRLPWLASPGAWLLGECREQARSPISPEGRREVHKRLLVTLTHPCPFQNPCPQDPPIL